jgi:hypothetical protein
MVIKLKTLFVNIHNITIKETDTHITLTNKDSQKCLVFTNLCIKKHKDKFYKV